MRCCCPRFEAECLGHWIQSFAILDETGKTNGQNSKPIREAARPMKGSTSTVCDIATYICHTKFNSRRRVKMHG